VAEPLQYRRNENQPRAHRDPQRGRRRRSAGWARGAYVPSASATAQQPSWSAAREGVVKSRASDTLAVFLAGTTGEEAAGGSALPRAPPLASSSIARRADPRALENPRGGGGGADGRPRGGRRVVD